MTDRIQARFIVHGRVQGVFFRESTRKVADPLGINGWAINLPDGTVEVVASAGGSEITQLRDYLNSGPVMARVDRLEEFPYNNPVKNGFITG